jgi:hypothetical protein
MGIFDFWKGRRTGPDRAGFFDTAPREAKSRYLAGLAGSNGLAAMRVSGFDNVASDRVHARFMGRIANGKLEFVPVNAQQAYDWALMTHALEKSSGTYKKTMLKNGGTIVLATDINVQSGAGLLERIKSTVDSFIQRYFTRGTKVEDTIETVEKSLRPPELPEDERMIPAYSMGNLFQGRYYGKDPSSGKMKLFDEKSFAIEIRGVDTEVLDTAADAIRTAFNQYAVLVINDNDSQVYMIEEKGKEAPVSA